MQPTLSTGHRLKEIPIDYHRYNADLTSLSLLYTHNNLLIRTDIPLWAHIGC